MGGQRERSPLVVSVELFPKMKINGVNVCSCTVPCPSALVTVTQSSQRERRMGEDTYAPHRDRSSVCLTRAGKTSKQTNKLK